jgi:sirohydrochlorin ferrochelatase
LEVLSFLIAAVGDPMSSSTSPSTALLLIAHGSRRREANEDISFLAEQLRREGPYPIVQTSYLELSEPTIADAGAECVAQGARRVILLPYFLSAGVHVREDLADARLELAKRFPDVEFLLAEPLGRHPLLQEVVLQRASETLKQG